MDCSGNITDNKTEMSILKGVLFQTNYEAMLPALEVLDNDVLNFNLALTLLENILPSLNDDERCLVSMDIQQWRNHWRKYCMLVPKENRTLTSFQNQISLGKTREIEISEVLLC